MKLLACDKLPGLQYTRCSVQRVIEDFEHSGVAIMEVVNYQQKNAESCRASLNNAIRSLTWQRWIKVAIRGDRVFLINTDKIGKQ